MALALTEIFLAYNTCNKSKQARKNRERRKEGGGEGEGTGGGEEGETGREGKEEWMGRMKEGGELLYFPKLQIFQIYKSFIDKM